MKKFMRNVCLILALSLILAVPAYADTTVEPRESAFFASYVTTLEKVTSTSFRIWFDVDSNAAMMDVLGVREIIVYRSSDQQSWVEVRTYEMIDYPEMIDTNSYSHVDYVTCNNALPGYYYTAYVTFYAENSRGIGERYVYTPILQM